MKLDKNALIVAGIIVLVAASRLLPDSISNLTAVGAIAFMSGALFSNKWLRYTAPVLILFISDIALNTFKYAAFTDGTLFYQGMWLVYLPFVLSVVIGERMLKTMNVGNVLLTALVSGVVFFLISNFGVWMTGTMYPMNGTGLLAAYEMGLPFFRNTLIGNMVYGLGIYFAVQFASKRVLQKSVAKS